LVVPVLRNVEKMNYADIERTISEFGEKVKNSFFVLNEIHFRFHRRKKVRFQLKIWMAGHLQLVTEEYLVHYLVHRLLIPHNQLFLVCMEYLIDR
jgi:hypothetical protein